MGYTYDGPFGNNATGWKFDPSIFSPPFFVGIGFVGYKYLKGPDGPGAIQLMSTFCNGAATCGAGHADPASMGADYRLMAGQPYPIRRSVQHHVAGQGAVRAFTSASC